MLVEQEYNRIEPARLEDCPLRVRLGGQEYRPRPKSRNTIGTLFAEIELRRYLYEATEPGERALLPLEKQLGIAAGLACGLALQKLAGSYFQNVRIPGVWVVAGAAGILLAAAIVASAWPAVRAARVDVIQALRAD